ncbi:MAG: ADP-glyceromanno-heptose 6-epimerase [Candidatus Mcinerneyibacterium aminivorans]|uniref:ADP-L-glycero-D-manno-heptose-6-epimerase n=1 Tax=Candidatus Mcinerneyibacterium aminivorans TaxID=2703815 RepID=A0A5D0MI74_9BACT|nr:MAG: ADP-glyceromanno-heptose 6-epimerase [Candidatus Mcinerneyibacterium aminivorans]
MIIVTGGAGFIGSNIIKGLNERGYEDILIVDDLKDGNKSRNMNALKFSDFIDKNDFINSLEYFRNSDIDAFFHQGACTDTMENDGRYMLKNNYEYSKDLLHFAMEGKIPFIYASSASVYGQGEKGFEEKRENENPLNVYAFSKFLFDQYVRKYLKEAKSQIVGLRYFNVYGQQENHKKRMSSPVLKFYNQLKENKKAKVFEGSEDFLRDFVYVDDVVDVNLFFYKNSEKNGIFNCGTGQPKSFIKVAKKLIDLLSYGEIENIPFPEKLKGKYQDFTKAELTKLRNAGYKKEFKTLEKGIELYFNYLEKNEGFLYLKENQ